MKRPRDFDAHRYLRETRHRTPQRRSTDRDYRPVWKFLAAVVVALVVAWEFVR